MPQTIDAADELGLSDYLDVLRRRWSWVLLPLVSMLALSAALTLRQAPRFCASSQVLIADSDAQVAIQGDASVGVANRDLANEINIAYSDPVRAQVTAALGTAPAVDIEGVTGSDILRFASCSSTAEAAATGANTWAEVYVSTKQTEAAANISAAVAGFEARLEDLRVRRQELRRDVEDGRERLARTTDELERAALRAEIDRLEEDLSVETELVDTQIQTIARTITQLELDSELARTGTVRIIQSAAPPREAGNAPLSRNLVLGGLLGLVLGAGVALVVENLDRSITDAADITTLPVLGTIPRPGRELRSRELSLATMNHADTPVAEAYQKVRTAVEFAVLGRRITSLLITSPNQSEGKTTTSSNLAWALSAIDHRVVLADVDFRRPRLHEVFGCRGEPGLSDHLLQQTPLNKLALRVDDEGRNLVIIPTGTRPPNPADFVASPSFAGLVTTLKAEADLVVLDAPPVLPVSDALSMARHVDAVVLVAKAGSTSRDDLAEATEALRAVGADVLGVCLVGVKTDPSRYGYEPAPARRSHSRWSAARTVDGTAVGASARLDRMSAAADPDRDVDPDRDPEDHPDAVGVDDRDAIDLRFDDERFDVEPALGTISNRIEVERTTAEVPTRGPERRAG